MTRSDDELEAVVEIARRAQRVVLDVYSRPFTVDYKSPGDPVTEADRAANDLICEALASRFPADAVVAEESVPEDEAELAELTASDRVFYVDPVDGTRELAKRNGEFAIMIGRCTAGRPELGVVLRPTTGELVAARAGGFRFLEGSDGARRDFACSKVADPHAIRMMVSRSHRTSFATSLAKRLGVREVIRSGSVGVKVLAVATGRAELYAHGGHGTKAWDTCAPEVVVAAAGGKMTDLRGDALAYGPGELGRERGLIASNGLVHEAALGAIAAPEVADEGADDE